MSDELETGTVFRLATIRHDFPPGSDHLTPADFELSSEDKAVAEKKGREPLLSVFEDTCTVEQAKALRSAPKEYEAFALDVITVRGIVVAGLPSPRIIRDPLDPPRNAMPGADAHCGILGLARKPGQPSKPFRELRVKLADASYPHRPKP